MMQVCLSKQEGIPDLISPDLPTPKLFSSWISPDVSVSAYPLAVYNLYKVFRPIII